MGRPPARFLARMWNEISDQARRFDEDTDALHILPLSIIPLQNPGLCRARLIKNARLQGVVEMFRGTESGSGQVAPGDLGKVFDFRGQTRPTDLEVIAKLGDLSSYDIYSLRILLRKFGIDVDDCARLKLSESKIHALTVYMRAFTKPLIAFVYGAEGCADAGVTDFKGILEMFSNPDRKGAMSKLKLLSRGLNIEVSQIPKFLEDYGDVYLSLAYYQCCLDENKPKVASFLDSVSEIKCSHQFKYNASIIKTCSLVEEKLANFTIDIEHVIDMFKILTEDMWANMSATAFHNMREMIMKHQTIIGGALCALAVKMNLWIQMFPVAERGGLSSRVDFIITEMVHGLEHIKDVR